MLNSASKGTGKLKHTPTEIIFYKMQHKMFTLFDYDLIILKKLPKVNHRSAKQQQQKITMT